MISDVHNIFSLLTCTTKTHEMYTSHQFSHKWDPYGCVHFNASASCHKMHNTVYNKVNPKDVLRYGGSGH